MQSDHYRLKLISCTLLEFVVLGVPYPWDFTLAAEVRRSLDRSRTVLFVRIVYNPAQSQLNMRVQVNSNHSRVACQSLVSDSHALASASCPWTSNHTCPWSQTCSWTCISKHTDYEVHGHIGCRSPNKAVLLTKRSKSVASGVVLHPRVFREPSASCSRIVCECSIIWNWVELCLNVRIFCGQQFLASWWENK